jgi:hypothetical protein
VLGHGGRVRGIPTPMQDAAVHIGMQRLHASIKHFRKAGEVSDISDGNIRIAQELGRTSGRNEFDTEAGKLAREILQASLVSNTEDGALDFGGSAGHDQKFYQQSPEARFCPAATGPNTLDGFEIRSVHWDMGSESCLRARRGQAIVLRSQPMSTMAIFNSYLL